MPSLKKNETGQRVLGGHPLKLPYQIQITRKVAYFGSYRIDHKCGAVLVSPKFVLTAKHCIFDATKDKNGKVIELKIIPVKELELLAGGFLSKDPNAQKRRIGRYIPINLRNGTSFFPYDPDIVMIEVDTPFDITQDVIPACLPSRPAPISSNCVGKVQIKIAV